MGSRTTIRDVAEWAGVSNATVSNVINDKGKVSESTRKEVLEAIEALNYRPNASAQRKLKSRGPKSIGLVIKEIHNPYFADVIVGAQEKAEEEGYAIILSSSEGQRDTEGQIVDLLVEKDVDGIIINPLLDHDADLSHLFNLKRRNVPFVLLEEVHGLKSNLVDVDNVKAAREVISYLIDLGHRDVIHFAGPEYSMHSDERIEGFQQAFFKTQQVYSEDYVVRTSGAHMEDGYRTGLEYFKDRPASERPTAVTCYNDLTAIGLLRALRELDIDVPGEVSVTGFDNIRTCDYAPVPLTSMGVPTKKMGRKAMEVLIRQLENSDQDEPEVVNLEAEMTVRASTAPVEETVSA